MCTCNPGRCDTFLPTLTDDKVHHHRLQPAAISSRIIRDLKIDDTYQIKYHPARNNCLPVGRHQHGNPQTSRRSNISYTFKLAYLQILGLSERPEILIRSTSPDRASHPIKSARKHVGTFQRQVERMGTKATNVVIYETRVASMDIFKHLEIFVKREVTDSLAFSCSCHSGSASGSATIHGTGRLDDRYATREGLASLFAFRLVQLFDISRAQLSRTRRPGHTREKKSRRRAPGARSYNLELGVSMIKHGCD